MHEAAHERPDALWYVGPGRAELRAEPVRRAGRRRGRGARPLVGASAAAPSAWCSPGAVPRRRVRAHARAAPGAATFPFPVKYGYATVGTVIDGPPELRGRTVFALHPHQTAFVLPEAAVVPVPDDVPPRRAVLAANMETALNAVWDAGALPGDRIAVVGAGVVGALVAWLCGAAAGRRGDAGRRAPGARGAGATRSASALPRRTRRRPTATSSSMRARRQPASRPRWRPPARRRRVVELSWYGDRRGRGAAGRAPSTAAGCGWSQPGRAGRAVDAPALDARGGGSAAAWRCSPIRALDALLAPDVALRSAARRDAALARTGRGGAVPGHVLSLNHAAPRVRQELPMFASKFATTS